MDVCPDYEDLFKTLNTCRIKYLVVGGQAVIFYSRPRYTKDIDVWIPADLNDPQNVHDGLKKFGAPLTDVTLRDLTDPKMIIQIGVPPVRIDIMMSVPGLSAEQAWKNRKKTLYGKTPIHLVSLSELIKAKKKAGRPQDKLDIQNLKKSDRPAPQKIKRRRDYPTS